MPNLDIFNGTKPNFAKEQLLEIASILNIDVSTIDFDLTK